MKQSKQNRQLFSSLINTDLNSLGVSQQICQTVKMERQSDEVLMNTLKREITELTSKNHDCETLAKKVKTTEMAIIELEKLISSQTTQCRQAREKTLVELANIRTKLNSQKRKMIELENEFAYIESCAGDIKAKLDWKTQSTSQMQMNLKATQERSKHRVLENQQLEVTKLEMQRVKQELSGRVDQANSKLASCIKTLEAMNKNIESKLKQKHTLEECIQKLAIENESLRKTSKQAVEDLKEVDQKMADYTTQTAEVQRACYDKEIMCQELRSEAFIATKKIEKRTASIAQSEVKLKSLNSHFSTESNGCKEEDIKLECIAKSISEKENEMQCRANNIKSLNQKKAALEALSRDILTEMQSMIACDNLVKNLASSERIYCQQSQ